MKMKLLEHQAAAIFREYGLKVNDFAVAYTAEEAGTAASTLKMPVVVKAQVPVGGRGKAGGIKFAADPAEAHDAAGDILKMTIKGCPVECVMLAEKAEPGREYYLSVTLDRESKSPVVIFCASGGMDIEEIAATRPDLIVKVLIDPLIGVKEYHIAYLAGRSGLDAANWPALSDTVKKLYKVFREKDCLLAEINPLLHNADGSMTALDGKVTVDDSALFRHKDLAEISAAAPQDPYVKEAADFDFLFIPIDPDGDIAVVSNGSGMLMTCMDSLAAVGLKTCAALDLGGGATADRVREALRILASYPAVKTIFISIFGGITRCDEIANGVKAAMQYFGGKQVIIRAEGTNKALGCDILGSLGEGIVTADSISDGVSKLREMRYPA